MPGHLQMTVSGTITKLMVDPNTYSEVDIVDFAPRAIAGSPTFSTMGLYLDVAQSGFGHGYGQWEYGEPKSYSYSGQLIDTRHGDITLMTNYTEALSFASGKVNRVATHHGTPILALSTTKGVAVWDSDAEDFALANLGWEIRDILSSGAYMYLSRSGRLQLADAGQVESATNNTVKGDWTPGWTTNVWANATVYILSGTGATESKTVASNTADTLTITGTWTANPDTTSTMIVYMDTGVGGNPPNDYSKMAVFGGYYWGIEDSTNYLHFWAESDGSDAEGDGESDAGVVKVGPVGGKLVNLQAFQNQLWAFRQDGGWTLSDQESDSLAYHALDFSAEVHANNFRTVMVWNGFLIFPIRNTLYKFRSGLQDITPPRWNEDPPYKNFGNWSGLFARGKFLYVMGQSNAANSDESTETTTGFVSLLATDGVGWHKLIDVPGTTPLDFTAGWDPTNDYIYFAAQDNASATLVQRLQLQTYSDLPYASYPTSGTQNWYSSYFNMGMARIPKSFASLILHGEYPSGALVTASYRVDDTTGWTTLSETNPDLPVAFTEDMQEVNFPTSTTGKRIQFRFKLSTTEAANTPMVKALIIKTMLRPDVLYGISCDVLLAKNMSDHNRNSLGHTPSELMTNLKAARDSVVPITLVDLHGTSRTVYLASMRFTTIAYENPATVQSIARCTFVNV